MTFDISALNNLKAGHYNPAVVGVLPQEAITYLRPATPLVFLSKETLEKNEREHPDVGLWEYLQIPDALRRGLIISERERPNCAVISFRTPSAVRYKVALKRTANGDIWITSFHRMAPAQTRRLLNRGGILRRHSP